MTRNVWTELAFLLGELRRDLEKIEVVTRWRSELDVVAKGHPADRMLIRARHERSRSTYYVVVCRRLPSTVRLFHVAEERPMTAGEVRAWWDYNTAVDVVEHLEERGEPL